MNKRGALGPGQIALIILALVAFALAALFLFGVFENKALTERELCRLSILSRATVPGIAEDAVPLNCNTEKICITTERSLVDTLKGKDVDCKQFAGEKNKRTVKVKISSNLAEQQRALETIQREVANAMYDCWAMTGQGKMDIFTSTTRDASIEEKLLAESVENIDLTINEIKPRCIVCSRIAFSDDLYRQDAELKKSAGRGLLEKMDINLYLSREKPTSTSSLTYWQTFTDQGAGSYATIAVNETNLSINNATYSNQMAIVFNQIKVGSKAPEDQFWDTFKSGATIGAVAAVTGPGKIYSYLTPGPGWFKALFKVVSVGGISYALAVDAEQAVRDNQAVAAATCDKFASKLQGDQYGCSVVKLMAWKVEDINSFCSGGIEGNL